MDAQGGYPGIHSPRPVQGAELAPCSNRRQSPTDPAGAHADYVAATDFIAFLRVAPGVQFDCVLEAKQKDPALLRLRRELARSGIVEQALGPSHPAAGEASTLQRRG
jgi:UV DNA damage endonuclease